jgi:tetratricopeptide (TPR) repeat protein
VSPARWLPPVIVVLVTLRVFASSLSGDFLNWDDTTNFVDNPHYRGLGRTNLEWMFTTPHLSVYQPLSWVSWGVDYFLWGMDPRGYHLTNLLLHAANTFLLYWVTLRLFNLALPLPAEPTGEKRDARVFAAFAALLWGIHPLRAEGVAWISNRSYLLPVFFALLSLLGYLRAREHPSDDPRCRRYFLGALFFFACSLLSKAIGLALPLVLLLLDRYPLKRARSLYALVREKIPFLLLSAAAAGAALWAKAESGRVPDLTGYSMEARLCRAFYGFTFYLNKTLLPRTLSPAYPIPGPLEWNRMIFLGPILAACGITAAAWLLRKRWPSLATAWGSHLLLLLPVSGLAQYEAQIARDSYTYLACMGWSIWGGGILLFLWRTCSRKGPAARRLGRVGTILLIGPLAFLGYLAERQTRIWHDSERLWEHALKVNWQTAVAHNNLGAVRVDQGRLEDALAHYRASLRFEPNRPSSYNNIGNVLIEQGKWDEAIEQLQQSLALAEKLRTPYPLAHHNLAIALERKGNWEGALDHYHQALELQPGQWRFHHKLGTSLANRGLLTEAVERFEAARALRPEEAQIHDQLGIALLTLGRSGEALAAHQSAVGLDPRSWKFRHNLAIAAAKLGNPREAVDHFRKALALEENTAIHLNLAEALTDLGQPEEARLHQQEALRLAHEEGDLRLVFQIQEKMRSLSPAK